MVKHTSYDCKPSILDDNSRIQKPLKGNHIAPLTNRLLFTASRRHQGNETVSFLFDKPARSSQRSFATPTELGCWQKVFLQITHPGFRRKVVPVYTSVLSHFCERTWEWGGGIDIGVVTMYEPGFRVNKPSQRYTFVLKASSSALPSLVVAIRRDKKRNYFFGSGGT